MQPIHLCIGAPRAGTSWLSRELSEHAGIFVPKIKEVRYWISRRSDAEAAFTLGNARKMVSTSHDMAEQTRWLDDWSRIARHSQPTIEEYINLMAVSNRPSIDISPAYCFLPSADIRKLRDGLPAGSKVLYFLRDPLDRTLSQIKLHYHLHGMYRGLPSEADLAKHLSDPFQQKRWDYAGVIDRWGSVFGDDFIPLSFDEVVNDPKALTLSIADKLSFALTPEALDRSPEDFFHSDKNQNAQIWIPSHNPAQMRQLAQAMLPAITEFAEQSPQPGKRWMNKLRAHAARLAPQPAAIMDVDLPIQTLMRMTESLGDNCEYGFWQRHRGYEPSSLFRWAITWVDSLLAFLDDPKRPQFAIENLSPHSPGMVSDATFGIKFHSKLVERDAYGALRILSDPSARAEIHANECAKIAHLQAKFIAQAKRQVAVYIIKNNKGLEEDKVRAVLAHLHRYNPNHHLLWVEAAGDTSLSDLGGGLLRGSLPAFAPYTTADAYSEGGWTALMTLLSKHPPIAAQIKRMQR